jgi:hypothetical protein
MGFRFGDIVGPGGSLLEGRIEGLRLTIKRILTYWIVVIIVRFAPAEINASAANSADA